MLPFKNRGSSEMESPRYQSWNDYRQKNSVSGDESEAGDEPGGLVRARKLEEILGIEIIYLDFEGRNPTGTHKDRIARAHVEMALAEGFSAVTVAPAGTTAWQSPTTQEFTA